MHIYDWQASNTERCSWHSSTSDQRVWLAARCGCIWLPPPEFPWLKPPLSKILRTPVLVPRGWLGFLEDAGLGLPLPVCCHPWNKMRADFLFLEWSIHLFHCTLEHLRAGARPQRAVGRAASDVSHLWKPWLSSCVRAAPEESDQAWTPGEGRRKEWPWAAGQLAGKLVPWKGGSRERLTDGHYLCVPYLGRGGWMGQSGLQLLLTSLLGNGQRQAGRTVQGFWSHWAREIRVTDQIWSFSSLQLFICFLWALSWMHPNFFF